MFENRDCNSLIFKHSQTQKSRKQHLVSNFGGLMKSCRLRPLSSEIAPLVSRKDNEGVSLQKADTYVG